MRGSWWKTCVVTAVVLAVLPLTAQARLTLSGFVDTSFFYENLLDTNTFSLDEVEIDVDAELQQWAGLRVDINFRAVDSSVSTEVVNGLELAIFDDLSADDVMEQGYIWLRVPLPFETTFRFGKFNAPIGWELLDPVDMYQFSHALVFNFGLPTNLTGALLAMTFNPMIDLQLYVVNGWDQLNDNNKGKTFGGRLGLTPLEGINVGFSIITGPELDDNDNDYRTVFDVDFTLKLLARLLIGGEFNYGWEEDTGLGGGDAEWIGGLLMAHYDFTDIVGLTVRFDIFNDRDGTRLNITNPAFSGGVTQYGITVAPTFALAKGVGFLVELRYDKADEDIFVNERDNPRDDVFTVAVEFTFSWQKTFEIVAEKN